MKSLKGFILSWRDGQPEAQSSLVDQNREARAQHRRAGGSESNVFVSGDPPEIRRRVRIWGLVLPLLVRIKIKQLRTEYLVYVSLGYRLYVKALDQFHIVS